MAYTIEIRDTKANGYAVLAECDDYVEARISLGFNTEGTWSLRLSVASPAADLLAPGSGLTVQGTGIVVRRDGVIAASGIATGVQRGVDEVMVTGLTDDWLLKNNAGYPTPTLTAGPYPDEYDVRTGVASTIMRAYVDANIGPTAPAAHRSVGLVLGPDPVAGPVITGRVRFVDLLTELRELAYAGGGLGFRILQDETASLVFSVYVPADKTASVVLSHENDTVGEYATSWSMPSANAVVVLGKISGGVRALAEVEDAASIARYGHRIVKIIDARDTDSPTELNQRAAVELAAGGEHTSFSFTPIETTEVRWGDDYDLGDEVTVVLGGEALVGVVRGVEITLAPGVEDIRPLVGTAGTDTDTVADRQSAAFERRLSNIERNFGVPDDSITNTMLEDRVKWAIGDLRPTFNATAQPGFLLCQGQAVSRAVYSELWAWVQSAGLQATWGTGDGSTTFNLPNMQGRLVVGSDGGHPLGAAGGAATLETTHAHSGAPHTHTLSGHVHGGAAHTHNHSHGGAAHSHNHSHGGAAHSHNHSHGGAPHSHSHSHSGAPHTHGMASHTHSGASHTHPGSHSHPFTTSANTSTSSRADGTNPVASATHGHGGTTDSDTNAPSASYSGQSGQPSNNISDGASYSGTSGSDATGASFSGSTGSDATGASFTGNTGSDSTGASFVGNTGSDSTGAAFTGTTGTPSPDVTGAASFTATTGGTATAPPWISVNWEIFTNV